MAAENKRYRILIAVILAAVVVAVSLIFVGLSAYGDSSGVDAESGESSFSDPRSDAPLSPLESWLTDNMAEQSVAADTYADFVNDLSAIEGIPEGSALGDYLDTPYHVSGYNDLTVAEFAQSLLDADGIKMQTGAYMSVVVMFAVASLLFGLFVG